MHNFIRCKCGNVLWHGDSLPSRLVESCEKCSAAPMEAKKQAAAARRWLESLVPDWHAAGPNALLCLEALDMWEKAQLPDDPGQLEAERHSVVQNGEEHPLPPPERPFAERFAEEWEWVDVKADQPDPEGEALDPSFLRDIARLARSLAERVEGLCDAHNDLYQLVDRQGMRLNDHHTRLAALEDGQLLNEEQDSRVFAPWPTEHDDRLTDLECRADKHNAHLTALESQSHTHQYFSPDALADPPEAQAPEDEAEEGYFDPSPHINMGLCTRCSHPNKVDMGIMGIACPAGIPKGMGHCDSYHDTLPGLTPATPEPEPVGFDRNGVPVYAGDDGKQVYCEDVLPIKSVCLVDGEPAFQMGGYGPVWRCDEVVLWQRGPNTPKREG